MAGGANRWPISPVEERDAVGTVVSVLRHRPEFLDSRHPLNMLFGFLIRVAMEIWEHQLLSARGLDPEGRMSESAQILQRRLIQIHRTHPASPSARRIQMARSWAVAVRDVARDPTVLQPPEARRHRKGRDSSLLLLNANQLARMFVRSEYDLRMPRSAGVSQYFCGPRRTPSSPHTESSVREIIESALEGLALGSNIPRVEAFRRNSIAMLTDSFNLCSDLLERVPQPRRSGVLITGTGGNVATSIVSSAHLSAGRTVLRFDHATGDAYRPTRTAWLEVRNCTRFITFTESRVISVQDGHSSATGVRSRPGVVDHFPVRAKRRVPQTLHRPDASTSQRRLLILELGYRGNRFFMDRIAPDPVRLEFRSSILRSALRLGFMVDLKPHPELPSSLDPIERDPRIRRIGGRFEGLELDPNTVIVLDTLESSAAWDALLRPNPIVMIDWDRSDWYPDAEEELRQRCAILPRDVPGDRHPTHVTEEVLRAAIAEADRAPRSDVFFRKRVCDIAP